VGFTGKSGVRDASACSWSVSIVWTVYQKKHHKRTKNKAKILTKRASCGSMAAHWDNPVFKERPAINEYMSRNESTEHDFNDLGISKGLLNRIEALGFKHPTPIQHKAIPVATAGEDVIGIAQTGSGKTLAFSVPMLQNVARAKSTGLVLLPTRELAVQVQETIKKLAGPVGLRTALVIGGMGQGPQRRALQGKPHVIIATPGRLIDLVDRGIADLSKVRTLVLDEADRMLDMGFAPQLKRIR